jgi:putative hemolysin
VLIQETQVRLTRSPNGPKPSDVTVDFLEGRYRVKLAETSVEVESALRLRYEVFSVELSGSPADRDPSRLEFDDHDFKCRHLIVIDSDSGRTVGTYRLSSLESAGGVGGFYSYNEFSIEDISPQILREGVEIGRACIAPEHRNTKVLFLLWKALVAYITSVEKRYFFGCCSIFTSDASIGASAYSQLADAGHLHETIRVTPRKNGIDLSAAGDIAVELPSLFNMYLRIGAKVCGPPMIDHEFGTIDFFVVCDTHQINEKYRRMFFGSSRTANSQ